MIAKYRKAEYPGEWWLTDFTMEQIEGRIINLERQLKTANIKIEALNKLVNDHQTYQTKQEEK
jgi:hypothetical protein